MGLDFSYLLYFSRYQQWEALQAVVDIAVPHQPPTRILFPDHELSIPLGTWTRNKEQQKYDEPELDFTASLYFKEDEAIQYYLRDRRDEESFRSPPVSPEARKVPIGYIYLTIYNESSAWYPGGDTGNLVAFNFGTTGTRMSLLFDESTSIRKEFIQLLERVPGVCGVFNREERGEVFWLDGDVLCEDIDDPYMLPGAIAELLKGR
jgi:hypothetical protein